MNAPMHRLLLVALAGLPLLSAGSVAAAESATESRLREALRSAQAQLAALENERGKLQAQVAGHAAELEAVRKQAAAAAVPARVRQPRCVEKVVVDRVDPELTRQLAELTEARARADASLQRCQADLQARGARQEELARQAEAEQATARERLQACEGKNEQMYQVASEVLKKFSRDPGGERLIGFGRVARENLAQDHQDKLLDQRVTP